MFVLRPPHVNKQKTCNVGGWRKNKKRRSASHEWRITSKKTKTKTKTKKKKITAECSGETFHVHSLACRWVVSVYVFISYETRSCEYEHGSMGAVLYCTDGGGVCAESTGVYTEPHGRKPRQRQYPPAALHLRLHPAVLSTWFYRTK